MLKCLNKRARTWIPVVQTSNSGDEVQQICCCVMNLEGMKRMGCTKKTRVYLPRNPCQGVRRKSRCKKKTRVYKENHDVATKKPRVYKENQSVQKYQGIRRKPGCSYQETQGVRKKKQVVQKTRVYKENQGVQRNLGCTKKTRVYEEYHTCT